MKKPLTYDALARLAASHPTRDSFGPYTDQTYLAFNLAGSSAVLSNWLKDLPCPTIGIGHGELSEACDVVIATDKELSRLAKNIDHSPLASMVLAQHLRASERLSVGDRLTAESFAYASLQQGPEFKSWRENNTTQPLKLSNQNDLKIDVNGELSITLNRPDTNNAIGVSMRDELCEALDMALTGDAFSKITLKANGRMFSTGGAIEEFGEISDPANAHWIRSLRLPAWRLARLSEKLHVHMNGPAIGAGIEMAAFGKHITATTKAWFQLPELKYGLIPGAGGTASIVNRIGRQRTAYMALSMKKIPAQTALTWGLVDRLIDD